MSRLEIVSKTGKLLGVADESAGTLAMTEEWKNLLAERKPTDDRQPESEASDEEDQDDEEDEDEDDEE